MKHLEELSYWVSFSAQPFHWILWLVLSKAFLFFLSYCNTGISLKLVGEQESVTAHWTAWYYLENNSESPLNLFAQEVLRPKFHKDSIWTWNSEIAPTLQTSKGVSGKPMMLASMGHSRGTFGSLDPCSKVTFSLENWRNSRGGQKSPSFNQLRFQPWRYLFFNEFFNNKGSFPRGVG